MKIFRTILALSLCIGYTILVDNRIPLAVPVPPLARFLDPMHGFWQNSYPSEKHATLAVHGVQEPIKVVYDSAFIPHIQAGNESDLYFAQGYVTALDRLWQMEFQTHAAAGRISEIMGLGVDSAFLKLDRDSRRMGLMFGAEQCLSAISQDPEILTLAQRYTAGVNAYIASLEYEDYPVEYKLLDYAPEPWSDIKIALLLKVMARTLNSGEKDLEMTNALKALGPDMLDLLFPDREKVSDPIVENPGRWPVPLPADTVPLAVPAEWVKVVPTEKTTKDIGSNNWAVSGSKTATGSPILCNDPHLSLNLPSIWYIIHLQAPGYNAMGASLPGSPAVISGFNDSIAWGETNAQRDLVDWYRITFRDKSRKEYLMDSVWKPTVLRTERIRVRGQEDFIDTVVYTEHGPIRFDRNFKGKNNRTDLAYRWISHDASNEMRTFYELNKGRNLSDYHRALDHYASPAQNFVFASVHGDIAMRIQGKFPVRRPNEGRFVMDGTQSSATWRRYIPNDHQVRYENPIRGFVSSANQYPADSTYPYYIMSGSYEAFRNRRINRLLSDMTRITPDDMRRLLMDNHGLKAEEALPVLLPLVNQGKLDAEAKEALALLKNWDFNYTKDTEAAAYFDSWWSAFMGLAWDEFRDQPYEMPTPTSFQTIKLMKEYPDLRFFDIASTPSRETLADLADSAFHEALAAVRNWQNENQDRKPTWAEFKNTTIDHLSRLPAFGRPVRTSGNREVINATTRRGGPSWRMVVSLERPIRAWGIYPGGQSGRPGDPAYDNMLGPWSEGELLKLHFTSTESVPGFMTLTLNPEP